MSPDEREFVDRMGLFMEKSGGPRTMGRLYGWLMICDPPHQSLTELATALGVSKASISTTARLLQDAGMIERHPAPKRGHEYRITPGGWTQVMQVQFAGVRKAAETLEFGLSVLRPDRAEQRARLEESLDFFAFTAQEADGFIQRWEEHRDSTRARTSRTRTGQTSRTKRSDE
jgi:DNA-binding transcriptional regulator GbsR (MarR family)